jgi:hypothetical protein
VAEQAWRVSGGERSRPLHGACELVSLWLKPLRRRRNNLLRRCGMLIRKHRRCNLSPLLYLEQSFSSSNDLRSNLGHNREQILARVNLPCYPKHL